MPNYCYTSPAGELFEKYYKMGEAPSKIVLDNGTVVERDFAAEHSPRQAGGGWPIECLGSSVHPSQAQELRDHFQASGVPTEVTREGRPVYRDKQHRERALKCRGLHDLNSFN